MVRHRRGAAAADQQVDPVLADGEAVRDDGAGGEVATDGRDAGLDPEGVENRSPSKPVTSCRTNCPTGRGAEAVREVAGWRSSRPAAPRPPSPRNGGRRGRQAEHRGVVELDQVDQHVPPAAGVRVDDADARRLADELLDVPALPASVSLNAPEAVRTTSPPTMSCTWVSGSGLALPLWPPPPILKLMYFASMTNSDEVMVPVPRRSAFGMLKVLSSPSPSKSASRPGPWRSPPPPGSSARRSRPRRSSPRGSPKLEVRQMFVPPGAPGSGIDVEVRSVPAAADLEVEVVFGRSRTAARASARCRRRRDCPRHRGSC